MKRSAVAVFVAVFMFVGGNVLAEESLSEALGVSINAGGTLIMQGTDKVNDGSDEGRNEANYSIDLEIEKDFGNGGSAFMHLEAAQGEGLDLFLETYGGINADAGASDNLVEISEIWYEHVLFDEKFTVTFGKINPCAYFDENEYANDETAQFVSPVFVNNAVIAFEDNNLGLRLTYSPTEMLDITYSYMTSNEQWNNIDCDGFNAIQLNLKPMEGANYRFMYWSSNRELEEFKSGDKKGGSGFALSLDQSINDNFGLFGRFGWADPTIYENSMAWSLGAQINGSVWQRDNDTIGLAIGQIMASSDFVDSNPGMKDDSETQTELYYSFAINDNFAITPALQYISKPAGGNAATTDDIFVYGIRTQISF